MSDYKRSAYLRIRVGNAWVSSPTDTRTTNPHLVATWSLSERAEAEAIARHLSGTVEEVK